MFKQISVLFLICFSFLCISAQTEKYNAPVKWERYKAGEKDISVLFPKLPVVIHSSNTCTERETDKYAAYAEGIIYGLNIVYKSKQKVPDYCTEKRKFDEKSFEGGVKEVKTFLKTEQETKINLNNQEVIKVKGEYLTYWLIDDFKNKRWFEFWVITKDENISTVKNFIESIELEKNATGIEIGKGADRTLGDASFVNESELEKNDIKSNKEEIEPLRIIVKPPPSYTEVARQAQVQGTVRLRVIFLASGGIGSIAAVSELPYGLTEQAMAAASKIVFIPMKRNGKSLNSTKIVEYSFSIY